MTPVDADPSVDAGRTAAASTGGAGGGNGKAGEGTKRRRTMMLSLAALGVVYGDIGTSPLYALRQSFWGNFGVVTDATNVYGIVSLIFWSLILLISLKYMTFVMRADNKGEGGTAALLALLNPWRASKWSGTRTLLLMGLFGSAMLYAGCTITPALTVLSAVEGLNVATHTFEPYVIPIALGILIVLFVIQKRGTESIGRLFGPILLLWFAFIAVLGIGGIVREPHILLAMDPRYAIQFFGHNGFAGVVVLSAVFLCMTGGEAMYADMGHFGIRPVRLAWYAVVLPAVLLNYFGQGALMLTAGRQIQQPFFDLAPSWALYPLVVAATVAAVIASQAVISGTFSMTRQFVQLGQLPRTQVMQTSQDEYGQIYIASVNWLLMLGTLLLVVGFKTSGALAGAYGISVATTMWVTTILAFFVARKYGWNLYWLAPIALVFFIADSTFLFANLFEVMTGGWYPILVAVLIFVVMTTWSRGRVLLRQHLASEAESPEVLLKRLEQDPPHRIPGTAVFPTSDDMVPPRLFYLLDRQHALQDYVLLVTVRTLDVPRVPATERLEIAGISEHINRVTVKYGFMQEANIPLALKLASKLGLEFDTEHMTYYIGREMIVIGKDPGGMVTWRQRLFSYLSRNAMRAPLFYRLPVEDVVELGFQVRI